MSMSATDADQFRFPYPGLRPFRQSESDIFFGRCEQIEQMLSKLESNRFLAVVGASGSGKSSLVRAGLLPALEDGFLSGGGEAWKMIVLRPGVAPYQRLAESFRRGVSEAPSDAQAEAFLEATLRGGPQGLLEAIHDAHLTDGTSVLLLVDQFEELFRFRHQSSVGPTGEPGPSRNEQRNDATGFVNLLLATSKQMLIPVYVVITMRSDFLGDCDAFQGLPEAISESQFLTPRLTREQLAETITGPLQLFEASAEPALVNRILNDVGNDADQLPLMQHALMRTWLLHQHHEQEVTQLRLEDYEHIGGLERALSDHADEAYRELGSPEKQRVAELMFRALCDPTQEGRLTRRIATIGEVAKVAGVDPTMVCDVARTFLRSDRSFLVITPAGPLGPNTTLDISHEALIRRWKRLGEWIEREQDLAGIYCRLAETARLWKEGKAGLWGTPELDIALEWRRRERPTEAWALRYDAGFELSRDFLEASQNHRELQVEHRRRQRRRWNRILIGSLVLVTLIGLYISWLHRKTKTANSRLQQNLVLSELAAAGARMGQGQLAEGLHAGWRALQLADRDDPKRRDVLNLLGAWSHRMGRRLQHPAAVTHVAFSPVDDTILTACTDNRARLWDEDSMTPRGKPMPHGDRISEVAFSPDGALVVTGSRDRTVRIWSAKTGESVGKAMQLPTAVAHVAFSPKGSMVAASCEDHGELWIWNVRDGSLARKLDAISIDTPAFDFVSDGTSLVIASRQLARRVDLVTGASIWEYDLRSHLDRQSSSKSRQNSESGGAAVDDATIAEGEPTLMVDCSRNATGPAMVASSDGWLFLLETKNGRDVQPPVDTGANISMIAWGTNDRSCVTVHPDHSAQLWDVPLLRPHRLLHEAPISVVSYSRDGTLVLTGSQDNTARLWRVPAAVAEGTPLRHQATVAAATFSSDGSLVVTGSFENSARLWRVNVERNHGRPLESTRLARLTSGLFSPDGSRIAAISRPSPGTDKQLTQLRLWERETGQLVTTFPLAGLSAMAFDATGRTLILTSDTAGIRLLDLASGQIASGPKLTREVTALAASPNGRDVLLGYSQGSVELLDVVSGERKKSMTLGDNPVRSLAFGPDGRQWIAGGEDRIARLWSLDQVSHLHEIRHAGSVRAVAFSPTGLAVASGGEDNNARLLLLNDGSVRDLTHQEAVVAVVFSPDGRMLVTGSDDNSAQTWVVRPDLNSLALQPAQRMRHQAPITSIAFSPDSRSVLTGSRDKTARLWDAASGHPLGQPYTHDSEVVLVAFSPAGRQILTGSSFGPLRLWNVPPPAADERNRLKLSLEVRTGYALSTEGHRGRLSQQEWLSRQAELTTLGGPCDARDWNDLSATELAQFPFVPFPFMKLVE